MKTTSINVSKVVIFVGIIFVVCILFIFTSVDVRAQMYSGNYGGYHGMFPYHGNMNGSPNFYQPWQNRYFPTYNNYNYSSSYYPWNFYPRYSQLSLSCSSSAKMSYVSNNNSVIWSAYPSGGSGYYHYQWNGTDEPTGLDVSSITVYYQIPGLKYMNVTVTSGDGQVSTVSCGSFYVNGYVYNYNYPYYYQSY